MPAACASSARVRITSVCDERWSSGPSVSRTAARRRARLVGLGGAARHLEQRLGGRRLRLARASGRSAASVLGVAASARRVERLERRAVVELVEPFLDHLERQEVLALLAQDEAQALDVGRRELAVARRRALGIDEPLALEEADLRDRDVGELRAQLIEHVADRDVRGRRPRQPSRGSAPSTKLSR